MTDREKAIVMAYTGYTMLAGDKLGIYYQYVQEKLGRSVMTHELAYEEVQDAIKDAAKEDFIALAKDNNVPRNGWISVKDRKPGNQRPVLVYIPPHESIEGYVPMGYVGMAYYTDSATGGFWAGTDGNVYGAIGMLTHEPSYWMLLPESPKEDKHESDRMA